MKQSDFVFNELTRRIVQLELAPGAALRETDIAAQLNVSRTPVREGLQRLVSEGLAETRGRSVYVAELTLQDAIELFQLREAIEPYATALCARRKPRAFAQLAEEFAAVIPELERIESDDQLSGESLAGVRPNASGSANPALDNEIAESPISVYYRLLNDLDEALVRHCGNRQITGTLELTWTRFNRLRLYSRRSKGRVLRSANEHLRICQAVAAGDVDLAIDATVQHLLASCRNVLEAMLGDPDQLLHRSISLGKRPLSTEISQYLAQVGELPTPDPQSDPAPAQRAGTSNERTSSAQ